MTYYAKAEEIPAEYHEHMKDMNLTDDQKVEMINNLKMFAEHIADMHFGTGAYAGPHHDAAKWRAEQDARWNRTPEQVYNDAYNYWMGKFGKYKIKKLGQAAAEAECREHAEWAVQKDIETKKQWKEFQERSGKKDSIKKQKPKRTNRASPKLPVDIGSGI